MKKLNSFPDSYTYVSILESHEDGCVTVEFPDLPEIIIEGNSFEEACENAEEALGLHLFNLEEDERENIPTPSRLQDLELKPNQAFTIIKVNMIIMRSRIQRTAVKKTLTIPKWLNDAAEKKGVNFSSVLQQALKKHLQLEDIE